MIMKNHPLQHKIEFYLVQTLLFFIRLLPKYSLHMLSGGVGILLYHLRIRRSVVLTNLKIAFGSTYSIKQRKSLAKEVYKNAARVLFEFLYMSFIPADQISDYIEIEGLEILHQAKEENKGIVLAGTHFGNWELLTAGICTSGFPFHIYAGQQKNQQVDDLINGIRTKFGQIAISKSKTAPFEMMKALKKGGILGMAGDLNMPHDILFVDFFEKKAAAWPGLATYALRRQAPLVFVWSIRTGPLKHRGFIARLDYVTTGDLERDIAAVTQMYISALEERIREHPDHYFWFNRRWKTRPSDEKDKVLY